MEFLNSSLLSILIWLPTVGALLVLLQKDRVAARRLAIATTAVTFAVSLVLFATFNWHNVGSGASTYAYAIGSNHGVAESANGTVQMLTAVPWIPSFNIYYRLGIDGLSFPLVLLSTFICLLSAIASWNIDKMTKGYFALFLFLETGILGTFLALDFFLFYVFFEVSLLPMYFLIGIWGGPRKEYAAIKFFLYTLVGSIGLLIVLIGTYLYTKQIVPGGTFDLVQMARPEFQAKLGSILAATPRVAPIFFVLLMI